MKIAVLGAGLIGAAMVRDLASDANHELLCADVSALNLKKLEDLKEVECLQTDLSEKKEIQKIASKCDVVIDALPGFLGFDTYRTVIESGKNIVDIAFFVEDPFEVDELAKKNGVTAVMDCGVAPGLCNMMIGEAYRQLDSTERAIIYVGGLPVAREWPYDYKAVFSPIDVIEIYTRPARFIQNGVLVTRDAMSDPELITFPEVGTLEAFNSDGLRTLMHTIECPNIKEKTLRYRRHIEKMSVLRETGFFGEEPIEVRGAKVRPIDFTSKLLFPMWELKEGEEDFTVMRVIVDGEKDGKKLSYTYDMLDRFDRESGTHSMARTTGYTATAVTRLIAEGVLSQTGVIAPEMIGQDEQSMNALRASLEARGVTWTLEIKEN